MSNNVDHLDHQLWIDHGQESYEKADYEYIEWMKWCEQMESLSEERPNE